MAHFPPRPHTRDSTRRSSDRCGESSLDVERAELVDRRRNAEIRYGGSHWCEAELLRLRRIVMPENTLEQLIRELADAKRKYDQLAEDEERPRTLGPPAS